MPVYKMHDRVKETSTTTGTGTFTVSGAVSQFAAFSARFSVGDPIYYAIVGQTGTEWEVGQGTLLSSTTFSRDRIFESSNTSGSPPNVTFSAVNFSAGTKDVFCTIPAERMEDIWTKGEAVALANGLAMP
jgi:hypothetical protein